MYPVLRWLAIAWLCAYVPVYAASYGWWHFLFLCNVGVLLTALGLMLPNQLLLSSQALGAPVIAVLWALDAASKVLGGEFVHGGTAYMWDESLPFLARVLSLYHLAWPFVLLYCLKEHGYDKRALLLQSRLALAIFAVGVGVAAPGENLNYVIHWPDGTPSEPRQLWNVLASGALLLVAYWSFHRLYLRAFKPPKDQPSIRQQSFARST